MTVTVNGPDGLSIQFPDGTAPDVINQVMSQAHAKRQASKPGMVASALEGAAQGLTFNLSDELEGGARALYKKVTGDSRPIGDLYNEGVAVPRARIAAAKEANPTTFLAGELGGGLVVPGGLARAGIRGAVANASGRGLGARTLAGAKEGAAYGAAYGAGAAEGGLDERAKGAGVGALTGAAVGSVVPAAVDAVGSVGTRVAAPFRAVANPQGFAAEKFGEAVARDMPNGAERFAGRVENMTEANPSARVMDAGGENVRGLMRAANNVPNEAADAAKRMVDARQANQYARIEEDLQKGFKTGRNYYDSIDDLAEKMDTIGKRYIEPSLRIETPLTPALKSILDNPKIKPIVQDIQSLQHLEGVPVGFETRTYMLHRLKLELDNRIGEAKRAMVMGTDRNAGPEYRSYTIAKRRLLDEIDNQGYKNSLRQYSDQASLKRAAEDGFYDFNKSAPEELKAALKGFDSNVEKDFYRLGVQRAIVDRVRQGNANRDRTDGVFSSPEMQMKLRAVMPDLQSLREFQKQLVIEAKMADSRKALQGNSTTAKQLAQGSDAGKTAGMITSAMHAATGRLEPMLNLAAQGMNRFSGITPTVAAELLRIGTSRDPRLMQGLAAQGAERARQVPAQRARTTQQAIGALLSASQGP